MILAALLFYLCFVESPPQRFRCRYPGHRIVQTVPNLTNANGSRVGGLTFRSKGTCKIKLDQLTYQACGPVVLDHENAHCCGWSWRHEP